MSRRIAKTSKSGDRTSSEKWFVLKIASFNAIAFCLTVAGRTYVDVRVPSILYGRWEYSYAYWSCLLGALIFLVSVLCLSAHSSWKIRMLGPTAIMWISGAAILPIFKPVPAHGDVWVWILLYSLASLLATWVHSVPLDASWISSDDIDSGAKLERIKHMTDFWRTIALSVAVGYMAILVPWCTLIWDRSKYTVKNPKDAFVIAQFASLLLIVLSAYVFFGVILESFLKVQASSKLLLLLKPSRKPK